MNTPAPVNAARPCSLAVVIVPTDEHGVAVCQWSDDNTYAVRLDGGAIVDVDPSQLIFLGRAAKA